MFVPLQDTNPVKSIRFQYVTVALIVANVLVFVLFGTNVLVRAQTFVNNFGLIPVEFLNEGGQPGRIVWFHNPVPMTEQLTAISYMFLHGGWLHLIGNMIFLWVFGDNVEDAMGHVRFFMFYIMCGIFAGVAHAAVNAGSQVPLVGASGAVSGVVAAYVMLHPRVRMWVWAVTLFGIPIPLRIPAFLAIGFWIGLQFFNILVSSNANVAWWAHIGGLAAGALLVLFMRRPGVQLFDRTPGGA